MALVYGGCALNVGINRNRNAVRETVNVHLTMENPVRPAVNFNDPAASGSFNADDDGSVSPTEATVTVSSNGFFPTSVTVAAGGTVTWTNEDDGPHQPDADDGDSRNGFGAPVAINRGERYRYTFLTPGNVTYHDDRDPTLRGVVVVQ